MNDDAYENVIIGSGEAGKFLAWTLAKRGQRTAIVERQDIVGGACPNVACLPTKNVIYGARVAALARRGGEFGVRVGPVCVDMAAVTARKRAMVDALQKIHLDNFAASGADVIHGTGRFVGDRSIHVALNAGGRRVLRGERVFLDVGTRAFVPPIPGLRESEPMTHVEALELDALPEHLVILGAGYVGLEFAQAFRRFGSRVTLVARGPRLLDREDDDVADAVLQLMRDDGVDVRIETTLAGVAGRSGESVRLTLGDGSRLDATHVLVAAGRTPNTDSFDPAAGGVRLDARGFIQVNERLETTAAGVWAMGECAGSPQFTHVSYDDYRIVRDNLSGGTRTTTGRLVPSVLFTDPEVAHVGLTEAQARAAGIACRLWKMPIARVLRTRTVSELRGFVKALVGVDDRILGFTAFCVDASETLAAVQTAMRAGLPYTALRDSIFPHPTMAEGLTVLFEGPPQPT